MTNASLDAMIGKSEKAFDEIRASTEDLSNQVDYKLSRLPKYSDDVPCQDLQNKITECLKRGDDGDRVKKATEDLKNCLRDRVRACVCAFTSAMLPNLCLTRLLILHPFA